MQKMLLNSETQVFAVRSIAEIEDCFSVFQELRPKLENKEAFIAQIKRQNLEGYILYSLREESEIAACIGFRIFETLGWGKILYIDDLITKKKFRKKGFGGALLRFAIEQAKLNSCQEVHLDSGHHRYEAHRLYLNYGFILSCHHLSLTLE